MIPHWHRSYPPHVSKEVDTPSATSVYAQFEASCATYGSHTAFSCMGYRISYADLYRRVTTFSSFLHGSLNLKKGDRFALMLPNCIQYPIALFAAMRIGLIIVAINPLYKAPAIKHQLADSGARAVLILENMAHELEQCLHQTAVSHVITTELGDCFGLVKRVATNTVIRYIKRLIPPFSLPHSVSFLAGLAYGAQHPAPAIALTPTDTALLQYTGGTTGVSKGAILSHGNLLANLDQLTTWVPLKKGAETIVTALPLYHIFALTINCLLFIKVGGHNCLVVNPRDIQSFLRTLKQVNMTAITGVNTLFNALLSQPAFKKINFSALSLSFGGGMAIQQHVAKKWKATTGCTLLEGYGLTECAPVVSVNPVTLAAYNGSVGLPLPSTTVSIRTEDNTPCGLDEIGELCVKGPQVMQGYWQQKTTHLDDDGWLHTGDIARMDKAGYVYLVSRKKDMIIVSGFNVYPNELEDQLTTLPGVSECAAIGIPDEVSGERVKLCIVRSSPTLTKEQIVDFCKKTFTAYKLPKVIEFYTELPKSAVGKILHKDLR